MSVWFRHFKSFFTFLLLCKALCRQILIMLFLSIATFDLLGQYSRTSVKDFPVKSSVTLVNNIFFFILTLQLASRYQGDVTVQEVLNKVDVVIMPVLNVDGYVYTWEKVGKERTSSKKKMLFHCIFRFVKRGRNLLVIFVEIETS